MRLDNAEDIRLDGVSALRAVYNGEIVWEPDTGSSIPFYDPLITAGTGIWSWGANNWGQLGIGNTTSPQTNIVQAGSFTDWTNVHMTRNDLYAIRNDGVHGSGARFNNQHPGGSSLGDFSAGEDWKFVAGSDDTVYAIRTNGTLWARGGGTGISGVAYGSTWTQLGSNSNWFMADCGRPFGVFLAEDGTAWSIGWNADGRTGLGISTNTFTTVITQIGTDTDWRWVACGHYHTHLIKEDGTLWSFGPNTNGRTGLNTTGGNTLVPTQVTGASNWLQVAGGLAHSLGVRADGTLWAWGQNSNFKTAQGTASGNTLVPTQVGSDTDWVWCYASYEASAAIKSDGTLWTWGSNASGATAQGTTSGTTNTPTQVGSDTDWIRVYGANSNFCAVKG